MANYNLYKTFLTVAECKNLTRASEMLFISQPAITMNIKQLEEAIGGKLFERKNKGVELTSLGQILYNRVSPLVAQLDELENLASLQNKLKLGYLRIGANSSNCNTMISQYLISFAKKYPDVEIDMVRDNQKDLLEKLKKNELDIVFMDSCKVSEGIVSRKDFPIEYQLIGSKKYFDKYNDHKFSFEDFPINDLILPNTKNNSRRFIDNFFAAHNTTLDTKYEVDNYSLIYDFVKNGLGIAFVSLFYYKDKIQKKEVYPIFPDIKINARQFSIYENTQYQNKAKDEFLKLIKEDAQR